MWVVDWVVRVRLRVVRFWTRGAIFFFSLNLVVNEVECYFDCLR